MIAVLTAMLLQAAVPTLTPPPYPNPGQAAEALGRRLADSGTLASLLPLMVAKETEELVAAHPELSETERATLRETARDQATAGTGRLLAATGHAYATRMSQADLATAVAFQDTAAAKAWRAAMPAAIMEAMQAIGTIDLKADTLKAFCARTGKACPKP